MDVGNARKRDRTAVTSVDANLAPPTPLNTLDTQVPPFFPVSIVKFTVLSLTTFGIYELFWFYKNWRLIREREGHLSPFWRTVFAYFFCYEMFKHIRDYPTPTRANATLPAGPLTAGWILVSLLWRLPDPYWFVSFLAFLFLIPVQMAANKVNSSVVPTHDPNSRFTAANWAAVVVGGLLLLLDIVGEFVTPP